MIPNEGELTMSEEILRVLLADFQFARVKCVKCGVVIEVAIRDLRRTFSEQVCKHCGALLHKGSPVETRTASNPFEKIAEACDLLNETADRVQIEFVVKQPIRS